MIVIQVDSKEMIEAATGAESVHIEVPGAVSINDAVCCNCGDNVVQAAMAGEEAVNEPDTLSPSEAMFGFAAWLTCRDEKIELGETCDCAPVAKLLGEFCEVNGLPLPRDGWQNRLVHPGGNNAANAAAEVYIDEAVADPVGEK